MAKRRRTLIQEECAPGGRPVVADRTPDSAPAGAVSQSARAGPTNSERPLTGAADAAASRSLRQVQSTDADADADADANAAAIPKTRSTGAAGDVAGRSLRRSPHGGGAAAVSDMSLIGIATSRAVSWSTRRARAAASGPRMPAMGSAVDSTAVPISNTSQPLRRALAADSVPEAATAETAADAAGPQARRVHAVDSVPEAAAGALWPGAFAWGWDGDDLWSRLMPRALSPERGLLPQRTRRARGPHTRVTVPEAVFDEPRSGIDLALGAVAAVEGVFFAAAEPSGAASLVAGELGEAAMGVVS